MKIFGFLLRLALLALLAVWLADKPGTVSIVWHGYAIDTSAAVLAVAVVAFAYICLLLHSIWGFLRHGPAAWRQRRRLSKLLDGQRELARGFSALAGGSVAEAGLRAVKARRALGETPLTLMLQAQAARQAGDEQTAHTLYETMTRQEETAMLGYRGLVGAAWRAGRVDEVAALLAKIEEHHLKAPWVHVVRFQLSARLGDWTQAQKALELARKGRALPRAQADENEAALLLADAKQALRVTAMDKALPLAERARKIAPSWVPASLVLAEAQMVAGHRRAALRTAEKAWERTPHLQILPVIFWALQEAKQTESFKFVEKLVKRDPAAPLALMAKAEAALRCDLWGEARRALLSLHEKHLATQKTYQMLARLERREKHDETAANGWLARAVNAPADPVWLCEICGASHETWEASCPSCAAFNHLVWETPGRARAVTKGPDELLGD